MIARVTAELQRASGDMSLQITSIERGSVRLQITLTSEGARRLIESWERGHLATICGFDVTVIEPAPDPGNAPLPSRKPLIWSGPLPGPPASPPVSASGGTAVFAPGGMPPSAWMPMVPPSAMAPETGAFPPPMMAARPLGHGPPHINGAQMQGRPGPPPVICPPDTYDPLAGYEGVVTCAAPQMYDPPAAYEGVVTCAAPQMYAPPETEAQPYKDPPHKVPQAAEVPPVPSAARPRPPVSFSLPRDPSAEVEMGPRRTFARRIGFVLGGLLIAGAVAAIALEALEAPKKGAPTDTGVAVEISTGHLPWVGSGGVNDLGRPRALEAECRRYEAERKWHELVPCADKLISVGHPNGPELRIRAVLEAAAAEQVADVEAALEQKDLKWANAELAEVWSGAVVYPEIRRRYEHAEAQAIDALARKLARVRSPGCKAYNALLGKARVLVPARVTAEAASRTPCR